MVDFNKIIKGLSDSGLTAGLAGGLAGGALTGVLSGKKGRKTAKTLLKAGGIAAVGGLAWKAYQSYRDSGGSAPGNGTAPSLPSDASFGAPAGSLAQHAANAGVTSDDDAHDMLIVRAMIAAALADGHLDGGEHSRIFDTIDSLNLDASEKGVLLDELRAPPGQAQKIVAQVTNVEMAVEVYAASLLAIDETTAQGRIYLESLASRLNLQAALVDIIHARVQEEGDAEAG